MNRILLVLLSLVIFNTSCGVASKSTNTANPTNKPQSDIRVVSNDDLIKNCQKIGAVSATSGWGGLTLQSAGRADVRRIMFNKTEGLDGNVLRINNISSGMFGAKGDGIAYYCKRELFNKIPVDEGNN